MITTQEKEDGAKGIIDDEHSKLPTASPTSGVSLLKLKKVVKEDRLTVHEEKMIIRHALWLHVWNPLGE